MAKRSSTPVAEKPETDPTPTEEITVTATAVAEPDTTAAEDAAAGDASEDEGEPDITALKTAIDSLVAGDLSNLDSLDFSGVLSAYNSLDRRAKFAATRYMNSHSMTLLESGNMDQARVVLLANKAVKASKPGSGERKPVNTVEAFLSRLASFQIAYSLFAASKPQGVPENFQEKVQELYAANIEAAQSLSAYLDNPAEDKGDAPEVSDIARGAVRLANRPAGVRRTNSGGTRRNMNRHIEQVFASEASGTFLTAEEISQRKSSEYGDDNPTLLAVTGRINGKRDLPEGLSKAEREGKLGVVKA